MHNKRGFAILRAAAAVVAAAVILFATGFAIARVIRGGETVTDTSALVNGAFVEIDAVFIMDIVGEERNAGGDITAYYAIVPVGDQFVTVRFPASWQDSIVTLRDASMAYLTGESSTMPYHILVTGTGRTLTDESVAQLTVDWFNENGARMVESGVIAEVDDYSVYLCPVLLDADRVGNVSVTAAVTLSVIAGVLLVYAVVEFTLVGVGVYGKKESRRG